MSRVRSGVRFRRASLEGRWGFLENVMEDEVTAHLERRGTNVARPAAGIETATTPATS